MKNDLKLRLKSGTLALMVAAGIQTASLPKTTAEDIKITYKQGTFIDNTEEDYLKYVVKKGDCSSIISSKICNYFGIEKSTKYWPVIAYLNDYPRVIQPGDIIIFPKTIDEMNAMLTELKTKGYISSYIQKNSIYNENNIDGEEYMTMFELVSCLYGDDCYVDESFVTNYLKVREINKKFKPNSKLTKEDVAYINECVPTIEELGYQKTK